MKEKPNIDINKVFEEFEKKQNEKTAIMVTVITICLIGMVCCTSYFVNRITEEKENIVNINNLGT